MNVFFPKEPRDPWKEYLLVVLALALVLLSCWVLGKILMK